MLRLHVLLVSLAAKKQLSAGARHFQRSLPGIVAPKTRSTHLSSATAREVFKIVEVDLHTENDLGVAAQIGLVNQFTPVVHVDAVIGDAAAPQIAKQRLVRLFGL